MANVGTSWESPEGTRTIDRVVSMPDGSERFVVSSASSPLPQLLRPEEIDSEIRRDTRNVESRSAHRRQAAEESSRTAQAREQLDQFLQQFSPMIAGKADAALTKQVGMSGEFAPRHVQIEQRVSDGWVVESRPSGERRFISQDGRFFSEKDTTKIGMDYAEFLTRGISMNGFDDEGQRPPRSWVDKYVKAAALSSLAAKGAPMKVQQRFYDRLMKLRMEGEARWPHVDFDAGIESAISRYLATHVHRGPGQDW